MNSLILVRHGNTFGPEDTPVWVGKNEDLPLVQSGKEQAQALARAFKTRSISPSVIFSSPLQRALTTAEVFEVEVQVLQELTEVDFGVWGGKSTAELRQQDFDRELDEWDAKAVVPQAVGWGSTEDELRQQVEQFFTRMELLNGDGVQVAVTSNGFLKCVAKYRLKVFESLCRDNQLKVRTGHLCELAFHDNEWVVRSWGISPMEFADRRENTSLNE